MEDKINQFIEAITSVNRINAKSILDEMMKSEGGFEGFEKLLVPSFERIGEGWLTGKYALAQVYMSGRICEDYVQANIPSAIEKNAGSPKIAIAVLEDYHMLGKRIVYSMLAARGVQVIDFGRMDLDALVRKTIEEQARVLMVSVLMLNSALKVERLAEKLSGEKVSIIVGGAPFRLDENLWKEMGAHAMCRTAAEAESAIKKVLGGAA